MTSGRINRNGSRPFKPGRGVLAGEWQRNAVKSPFKGPSSYDIRSDVTELLGLTSDTVLRRTAGAESSFPSDLNRGDSRV